MIQKWKGKKKVKVSAEYDSEQDHILTKASVKVLEGLAKLKASCQVPVGLRGGEEGGWRGGLGVHQLHNAVIGLFTENLFIDCNLEEQEALVGVNKKFKHVKISYDHEVKAQHGHFYAKARLPANHDYSVDVAADFSTRNLSQRPFWRRGMRSEGGKLHDSDPETMAAEEDFRVQTMVDFPLGRVFYAASNREEEEEVTGLGGMLETRFGEKGRGRVEYLHSQKKLDLKYHFKDDDFTIAPTLSLPSRQCLLVFKRRFDDAHKLSAMYSPQDVAWQAEYKFQPTPQLKLKVGHHSAANTLWTSVWVGQENLGAKHGPKQCKGQVLLQFNHETNAVALLFKFKTRLDLFV